MPGEAHPTLRAPAVAGMFYPADAGQCRRAAQALLQQEQQDDIGPAAGERSWTGAIVPHAGWVCSGAIAARSIAALARSTPAPDVVVVFGAVHTPVEVDFAALDAHDAWRVPGGDTPLAADAMRGLLASAGSELFAVEPRLHRHEHAVEVELPLIQQAWPGTALLPIEVPAIDEAVEIGRRTAEQLASNGARAVYLASSDLTHYGPAYRFAPAGVGPAGLAWAKDNDRRVLELVTAMRVERVVPDVRAHLNACGGGAITAMLAACRERGATRGTVIRHASSFETLADVAPQRPENAVGYAGVVVGR